jgi:hypothetical protein
VQYSIFDIRSYYKPTSERLGHICLLLRGAKQPSDDVARLVIQNLRQKTNEKHQIHVAGKRGT